jgi:hypothetical protein
MSDFDKRLKQLLSEDDERFIANSLEETGFYSEVYGSLKGPGSAMHILTWAGIGVACMLLFYCIWQFFQAETVRDQILFAAGAIMLNTGQIALKLWFNMRLNRRAVLREIKRLHLAIANQSAKTG